MNIDEGVETLTQSVELLSQMRQDNEKRYAEYFSLMSQSLQTLTRIVESREASINRLEGNGSLH